MTPDTRRRSRQGRLLSRLLLHDRLRDLVRRSDAQAIYDQVENQLSWDFHYWLQRGSYEVEAGDLTNAENFLQQARSLEPDNHMALTEWSYLRLRKAVLSGDPGAQTDEVLDALDDLDEAIRMSNGTNRHAYHVMGIQVLRWLKAANPSDQTRSVLLLRVRNALREGCARFPKSRELAEARDAVERAYLMTAVPRQRRPT